MKMLFKRQKKQVNRHWLQLALVVQDSLQKYCETDSSFEGKINFGKKGHTFYA